MIKRIYRSFFWFGYSKAPRRLKDYRVPLVFKSDFFNKIYNFLPKSRGQGISPTF